MLKPAMRRRSRTTSWECATEAERYWNRVLELDPKAHDTYRWLAYVAMDRGQYRRPPSSIANCCAGSRFGQRPVGTCRDLCGAGRHARRPPAAGAGGEGRATRSGTGLPVAGAGLFGASRLRPGEGELPEGGPPDAAGAATVLRSVPGLPVGGSRPVGGLSASLSEPGGPGKTSSPGHRSRACGSGRGPCQGGWNPHGPGRNLHGLRERPGGRTSGVRGRDPASRFNGGTAACKTLAPTRPARVASHLSCLLSLLVAGCGPAVSPPVPPPPVLLHDVTAETGIAFRPHRRQQRPALHRRTVGCGLATLRLRRRRPDRHLLPQRRAAAGARAAEPADACACTGTRAAGRSQDVTERRAWRTAATGWASTVGDYDNDGDPDIYVNNFGPNVLYRNNGDGTFTDVTAAAGRRPTASRSAPGPASSTSTATATWTCSSPTTSSSPTRSTCPDSISGFPAYAGPQDYQPRPPHALSATTATARSPTSARRRASRRTPGTGMGMVCADYDDDGDTDIFVGNDVLGELPVPQRRQRAVRGSRRWQPGWPTTARRCRWAAWASTAATTTTTAGSTST